MLFSLLADMVLVVHLAFVGFVVLGGPLVLRCPRVAWVHVRMVIWAVAVEWTGWVCPLTPLENWLRSMGGSQGYRGGFLDRYLLPILYPEELTRSLQMVLGAVVMLLNMVIYGVILWRKRH